MPSLYQRIISELAPDLNAGHAEAVIRLKHRTLDSLTRDQFADELEIAREVLAELGPVQAAELADSFDL